MSQKSSITFDTKKSQANISKAINNILASMPLQTKNKKMNLKSSSQSQTSHPPKNKTNKQSNDTLPLQNKSKKPTQLIGQSLKNTKKHLVTTQQGFLENMRLKILNQQVQNRQKYEKQPVTKTKAKSKKMTKKQQKQQLQQMMESNRIIQQMQQQYRQKMPYIQTYNKPAISVPKSIQRIIPQIPQQIPQIYQIPQNTQIQYNKGKKQKHEIFGLKGQAELFHQKLKNHRQNKSIQELINNQYNQKQNLEEERKINSLIQSQKQSLILSQFVYQTQGYIFRITRGKVPKKHDKFIDIQVHQSDLQQQSTSQVYYRHTLTNANLPMNLKAHFPNVTLLYSRLVKYKQTIHFNPSQKERIQQFNSKNFSNLMYFSFQDFTNDEEGQIVKISLSLEKFISNKNSQTNNNNSFCKRNLFLENQIANLRLETQKYGTLAQKEKLLKIQALKQLKQLKQRMGQKNISSPILQSRKQTTQSPPTQSSLIHTLSKPVTNNLQSLVQKPSAVQILDVDDDDYQYQHIQSIQSERSDENDYKKKKKKNQTKKSKSVQGSLFQHQTNQPGKFTHAVNGKTMSVNQILSYKSTTGQPLNQFDNDSFIRPKNKVRLAQNNAYIDKKSKWLQYITENRNQTLKAIIQDQSQFLQCKKFVKTAVKLPTMGFMQLFFHVLELDLSDNKIKTIQGLKNLKKLRVLDLNKNEISNIDGLQQNLQLKQLYLRQNRISIIEKIFHLPKLQIFSLQANQLTHINQRITELQSLKIIHLNLNKLEKLPMAFLSMTNLKTIRLFGNVKLDLKDDQRNRFVYEQLSNRGVGVYCKDSFD